VPKRAGRRTQSQEKIARDRIDKLLNLAMESSNNGDSEQAKRFVELARLISKRYNQRLTKFQRFQICRDCNSFLNSKNSKNRLSPKGWKIITCLDCGSVSRYGLEDSEE
jgi:RNase P subunit RPR2|tara:strand:+ start:319 stop:645 length:327 start_codon:yes stop_codon:yes gene_type:complete